MENTRKPKYTAIGRLVLGIGLHAWEHIMLWWLLAAAALSAFAVVFSTTCVVRLQRAENERANRELEAYKASSAKEIAAAEAQGKVADQKAAEVIERARKSELELAKIQTPRTLTSEQQDIIVKLLAATPKGPVSIDVPFVDSTDAKPFARSIEDALKKAGFEISGVPGSSGVNLSWDRPGAWILFHDTASVPPHASPLQTAFAAVGIYLEGIPMPNNVPLGMVVIAVSSHPLKSEPIPDELLKRIPKIP
jgi:hypothetical protein